MCIGKEIQTENGLHRRSFLTFRVGAYCAACSGHHSHSASWTTASAAVGL